MDITRQSTVPFTFAAIAGERRRRADKATVRAVDTHHPSVGSGPPPARPIGINHRRIAFAPAMHPTPGSIRPKPLRHACAPPASRPGSRHRRSIPPEPQQLNLRRSRARSVPGLTHVVQISRRRSCLGAAVHKELEQQMNPFESRVSLRRVLGHDLSWTGAPNADHGLGWMIGRPAAVRWRAACCPGLGGRLEK